MRFYVCQGCGEVFRWYGPLPLPRLCCPCWRPLRFYAPHAPACGCQRCDERFGPTADRAYSVRPAGNCNPTVIAPR